MSQIHFAANLSADDIPLLSALAARSVIVSRIDQDYELDVNTQQRLQKERKIPQVFYVHNVMPTGQGYQTVGFSEKIPASASFTDFQDIFVLRDPDENKSFFSPSSGKNYVFDRNTNTWESRNPIIGHENALVTIAYLEGETYIFYEKIGCYKYDRASQTLVSVTLTGLTVTNIIGICSAMGFLLAWDDDNTIYRGQAVNVTDFTPDPSLGSGSGIPEGIAGKIVAVLPIANGYIVYTTANAVAAAFQQNTQYPFVYREIPGSYGIADTQHVSYLSNLDSHFAWTFAGLQRVNKSKAELIFPELSDFIVAKIFEDFDTSTYTFAVTELTEQIPLHLAVVGSRYLVISYSINEPVHTHAIVFDVAFRRWGKLKISHVQAFSYVIPNLSGETTWSDLGDLTWTDLGETTWEEFDTQVFTQETPKDIIGFLTNTGQVKIINFDLVHSGDSGVLVCGKYQYQRERNLQLDEIHLENVRSGSNFDVRILPSLNGKTFLSPVTPYLAETAGQYRKYLARTVGMNHSLVFSGTFHMMNLELVFHVHGKSS